MIFVLRVIIIILNIYLDVHIYICVLYVLNKFLLSELSQLGAVPIISDSRGST